MKIRLILTFLLIFFQTACSHNLKHLSEREQQLSFGNDYNSHLSREYLKYSRTLENQKIKNGADYFATKGLRVVSNKEVLPETANFNDIDPQIAEEYSIARKRLDLLLNSETKQLLPDKMARLVMLHDCWLNNEQKDWKFGALAQCKERFFNLLDEVEEYIADLEMKKEVKVIDVKEPEFRKFNLYFDFNSFKINRSANQELISLIEYLKDLNGDFRILLSGNSDRSGKEIYNDSLARKRVLIVQDVLIKNGVSNDVIEIDSYGENKPEIITKDNKENKYNRLVGVYVLKGVDSMSAIPLPLIDNYIYKKEIKEVIKRKGIK